MIFEEQKLMKRNELEGGNLIPCPAEGMICRKNEHFRLVTVAFDLVSKLCCIHSFEEQKKNAPTNNVACADVKESFNSWA